MQPLSQRSTCHEQQQHNQTGRVKLDAKLSPIQSVGRYLTSLLKSVVRQRPNYSHSLNHLSEHQLRDIGFTRDSSAMNLPVSVRLLESGLQEYRHKQIRRLPKS